MKLAIFGLTLSALPRVLGGISPIGASFIKNMETQGVLDQVDVVAVHGFQLDWAESRESWFDRQMRALDELDVTLTYCFTPEHCGVKPHHTSPPRDVEEFADFCARMTRRYAAG